MYSLTALNLKHVIRTFVREKGEKFKKYSKKCQKAKGYARRHKVRPRGIRLCYKASLSLCNLTKSRMKKNKIIKM